MKGLLKREVLENMGTLTAVPADITTQVDHLTVSFAGGLSLPSPLHSTTQWISTYPPSLRPSTQPHLNTGSSTSMDAGSVDPGPNQAPGVASSSSLAPPVTGGMHQNHHLLINSITSNPRATPVIRANTAALPVTQAHLARCHRGNASVSSPFHPTSCKYLVNLRPQVPSFPTFLNYPGYLQPNPYLPIPIRPFLSFISLLMLI